MSDADRRRLSRHAPYMAPSGAVEMAAHLGIVLPLTAERITLLEQALDHVLTTNPTIVGELETLRSDLSRFGAR